MCTLCIPPASAKMSFSNEIVVERGIAEANVPAEKDATSPTAGTKRWATILPRGNKTLKGDDTTNANCCVLCLFNL